MLLLLSLFACAPSTPQPAPEPEPVVQAVAPRLAVLVVVDQLTLELFTRLRPHYSGGFATLSDAQSWVGTAHYSHAVALTCPGHATLATGASPRTHGIIGNAWVEADEVKYCGDVTSLRSEGIADKVKAAGGTVASFSLKDRAALMLGGRSPDAIAWYDKKTGVWCERAPDWLPTDPITAALTTPWEAREPALYASLQQDDNPWEEVVEPLGGTTFPHSAPGVDQPGLFRYLPAAGTVLTDIAIEAVDRLELGADDTPDLLALSYSQTDYIGHAYTAQSWEAMDGVLALDADLARLLAALDAKVGQERYALFLTADHGAAPGQAKRIDPDPVVKKAEAAWAATGLEGELKVGENMVYLPKGGDPEARAAAARSVAAAFQGADWVAGAWAWRVDPIPKDQPHHDALMASLDPERAGDIYVLLRQDVLLAYEGSTKGTSHGTPYSYDTDVPLLIRGPRVRATSAGKADSRALAPTIATWLGIDAPGSAELPGIEGVSAP